MHSLLADFPLAGVLFAFSVAAFIKGVSGLGFSTSCLPLLYLFLGLKEAMGLVLIPSIVSNVIVMRKADHFKETVHRFWPLFIFAVPGVFLGLALMVWIDQLWAMVCLGAVLILYALYVLRSDPYRLPKRYHKILAPVIGLTTGGVNGLTGSQVMPVMPYLMGMGLSVAQLRQALNCSFTLSSLTMMVALSRYDLFSLEIALVSLLGLIPIFIGVRLGSWCQQFLSARASVNLMMVVLIAMGASLLVRPFL